MAIRELPKSGDVILHEFDRTYNRAVETIEIDVTNETLRVGQVLELIAGTYRAYTSEATAAILLEDVDVSTTTKQAVVLLRGPATVVRDRLRHIGDTGAAARAAQMTEDELITTALDIIDALR
jgi:hypothetical protein